jgi:hypothetical protein
MAGRLKEKPCYGYFVLPGLRTTGRKTPPTMMFETYMDQMTRKPMKSMCFEIETPQLLQKKSL